ncbi:hypothetical protein THRCLA_20419 [Thraustotheca clavata]|uniref:Uncharacterized protein n=1 Tax=Thraustotheca clavata TaxID=74557 RepID=A0A1W0A7M2_9STRA|nr:hypothetical protein THRCLA_20419 [Thraustotheca clavata]
MSLDSPRRSSPVSKRRGFGQKSEKQRVYGHTVAITQVSSSENNPTCGLLALDEWLATFENEILNYESLGGFAEVKLREAIALTKKFALPLNRFRAAVVCCLMERVVLALMAAESCKRYSSTISMLGKELLTMIYIDADDEDSDDEREQQRPHTLSYFLAKLPYFLQLRKETGRKDEDFRKHQAVLKKLIQTMFQNVGSVFQAWKMYTRSKREDRLGKKAAQVTGKVLANRGLVRLAFIYWAQHIATIKLEKQRYKGSEVSHTEIEKHLQREHSQALADLKKQLNQANESILLLKAELHDMQSLRPPTPFVHEEPQQI